MWRTGLAVALAIQATSASARIETVKSLHCNGSGEDFSVVLDHEAERATIVSGAGNETYRYEPQGAFLTWQLIDDAGEPIYILREGDAINGDFGWYFAFRTTGLNGAAQMKNGGECIVLSKTAPATEPVSP